MTENRVKEILRNHKQMLESIHSKMLMLYEELSSDQIPLLAAPSSKPIDGMPGAKHRHRDLSDVLERIHYQELRQDEERRIIMWELSEKEEEINRVWCCFCALEDPAFTVLKKLYVDGEKYETVERESGKSHKTFERLRAAGINAIIRFYDSETSVYKLIRHKRDTGGRESFNPAGKAGENQMSLFDFMEED